VLPLDHAVFILMRVSLFDSLTVKKVGTETKTEIQTALARLALLVVNASFFAVPRVSFNKAAFESILAQAIATSAFLF